jgi:hypothetical protein
VTDIIPIWLQQLMLIELVLATYVFVLREMYAYNADDPNWIETTLDIIAKVGLVVIPVIALYVLLGGDIL